MIEILILEQGYWPNEPFEENLDDMYTWMDEGYFERICHNELDEGDHWIVLSKPEKALEDMTEAELIERILARDQPHVVVDVTLETLREALIRDLK